MCGLSNSGKTTKATEIANKTGAIHIELDSYFSDKRLVKPITMSQIREIALLDAKKYLEEGKDVIYDSIATNKRSREKIRNACRVEGCEVECIYMDTPIEIIKERSSMFFPNLAKCFEIPTEAEGFDKLTFITYNTSGKEV